MRRTRLLLLFLLLPFVASLPPAGAVVVSPAAGAARTPSQPSLRFDLGPEQLRQQFQAAMNEFSLRLHAVVSLSPSQVTFRNTVQALENASASYSEAVTPLLFLSSVSPDPQVRAVAAELELESARFAGAWITREDVYARVRGVSKDGLEPLAKRLVDAYLYMFRDSGMGLSAEKRQKLRKLEERLSALQSQYSKNLREHKDQLEIAAEDLAGLPANYVAGLPRTPEGKYVVGLDYPSYYPFMRYAQDAGLRKQLLEKFHNRAAEQNVPALKEILRLRRDTAKLLGHKTYSDRALAFETALEPANVKKLLGKIKRLLFGQARREMADLLELKRRDQPDAERIEQWEFDYYSNKLRLERFGFDPEEVRAYFPVDTVISGTMKVYQNLLGVVFTEAPSPHAWHPDVRLFEISDASSGKRIGHFYLDLYPREGKYGHAAEFGLIAGRELPRGRYREPVAAMVANFPKATAGTPALLGHDDVETFFHEFGHLMHETLTKARYATFSGTSVSTDFVEAPSQMLENFVWEKEVLAELSGHYEDPSRKLPDELISKMRAARRFNQALSRLQYIAKVAIDMAYHTAVPRDTTKVWAKLYEKIALIRLAPGTHPEASFEHTATDYASLYYSYIWSERYAREIFGRFLAEGVLNPAVGMDYRRAILERGGEVVSSEEELVKAFLGREPTDKPLLDALRARKD